MFVCRLSGKWWDRHCPTLPATIRAMISAQLVTPSDSFAILATESGRGGEFTLTLDRPLVLKNREPVRLSSLPDVERVLVRAIY